ncbi:hypothetical protein HF888_14040 [Bermanella marisrubri]|uniref:Uncharacterized protein n=1 Tax=Bermanella marisrubri TaxID=207949 RepID=Q1MZC7_9GAMM|nr:hypothetical protein [Bermanella marisrubri]EAT11339.1 hypothetical protein RED65_12967 [Oceanobacter sp. RED65] [Bermanella marisrubri]QIZ85274.1 hypothetical protein HF888_14040 [Bermanella marisrubri]
MLRVIHFACLPVFLLSLVSFSGIAEENKEERFTGKAYDQQSGDLIYTEQHSIKVDESGAPVSGNVVYTQANGEELAVKQLNYGKIPYSPSFQFDDQRLAKSLEVQVEVDRLLIRSAEGEESVKLPRDKPAVVDAGFNYFMQQSLPELKQGKTLSLAFLAVGRAEFYGFEVSPEKINDKTIRIKLAPSAWVLSVLVDPTYLTYDVKTSRLIRYEGLGNIERVRSGKGLDENYVVRIEYEYPE